MLLRPIQDDEDVEVALVLGLPDVPSRVVLVEAPIGENDDEGAVDGQTIATVLEVEQLVGVVDEVCHG